MLRQTALVTVGGIGAGLGAAFVLSRFVSTVLYGITPRDVTSFVVVPAVLLGIAALACIIPATRAARIDPLEVLRA